MLYSEFKQHVASTNETNHHSKTALEKLLSFVLPMTCYIDFFCYLNVGVLFPVFMDLNTSRTLKLCDNELLNVDVPAGIGSKCKCGQV